MLIKFNVSQINELQTPVQPFTKGAKGEIEAEQALVVTTVKLTPDSLEKTLVNGGKVLELKYSGKSVHKLGQTIYLSQVGRGCLRKHE